MFLKAFTEEQKKFILLLLFHIIFMSSGIYSY